MTLDDLLSPQRAYVAVGSHVYRIRAATSRDMLTAGLAHVVGLAALTRLKEEAEIERERAEVSAFPGATPEAIDAAVAQRREAIEAARQDSLAEALAGDPKVQERTTRALVVAGVDAVGILDQPIPPIDGMLHEGVERYGPDWRPEDHCRLMDGRHMIPCALVARELIAAETMSQDGAAVLFPVEAIPLHAQQVIAGTAYELAEGGAAKVAPFRASAWRSRAGRSDREEVPRAAE